MIETNLDSCVEPLHCVGHTKFLDWVLVEPFSRIGARRALLKNWCSSSPFQELVLVEPFSRIGARRALLKNWCSSSPFEELVLVEPF
jgi:hypothetical protein